MEKKQPCHVEWGRLEPTRQPIMTGTTTGTSQLVWVACRTSRCLVHVFYDSHLMSIWRFTSDPTFLQFGSSREHAAGACAQAVDNTRNEPSDMLLLVITSDTRIWLLDLSTDYQASIDRPAKKRREATSPELQKALQENVIANAGPKTSVLLKPWQKSEGGMDVDPDICGGNLEGLCVADQGRLQEPGGLSADANVCTGDQGCLGLKMQWENLSARTHRRYCKRPEVRLVSSGALLGMTPGVTVAAFGPNGFIGLLSSSGSLNLTRLSLSENPPCTSFLSVRDEGPSTRSKDPTCIIFASLMVEQNTSPPQDGKVAILSKKLFGKIFGDVSKMVPTFGLIQGDSNGFVYAISLNSLEVGVKSCTRLLCNLSQPIVAIFAIPSSGSACKKLDQAAPEKEPCGDSLLIIGQLGRAILITDGKGDADDPENGPFWPVKRNFSWTMLDESSTVIQLMEKNLEIHEWNLNSLITSACMLGPFRLCYCSGVEILFVDLLEMVEDYPIYPKMVRAESVEGAGKQHTMASYMRSELREDHSAGGSSGLPRKQWSLKAKLVPHLLPVAEMVVAIAGRGVLGSLRGSRPLVALTARGRLLGVEVSDHVSSPAMADAVDTKRSWQPLRSRMEERVKDLLQIMGEVTDCTDLIKNHNVSITFALKELANAIPLISDICTDARRDTVCCPGSFLMGETYPSKLLSFLTIEAQPAISISPEKLAFRPCVQEAPSNCSCHSYSLKFSIMLYNHTLTPLSPYWSLLLELHTLHSDIKETINCSTVINRGLGLPVGAHFSHDFHVELPNTGFGPLLASLFLCHLHDPHQTVVDLASSGGSFSRSFCEKPSENLVKKSLDTRDKMDKLAKKFAICNEKKPGMSSLDKISDGQCFGAVCVLLSRYRIDLLSVLGSPVLQSVCHWNYRQIGGNLEGLETSSNIGEVVGFFSGKVTLSCPIFQNVSHMEKIWQKLQLGDILRKGVISKGSRKLTLSLPDSGTISISLECGPGGADRSISLMIHASSLLLGSCAREALLWRLGDGEFVVEENISGDLLECNAYARRKDRIGSTVNDLAARLQTVDHLWRDVLTSKDAGLFRCLLDDTWSAIEAVMKAYRMHREESRPLCTT